MPIIKSAKKRMRQTAKRRARNIATKRTFKDETKALLAAIEAKDAKKAAQELKKVQSALDVAVKKNVLKKNTAARKLSSLVAKVKAVGGKPTASAKKPAAKPAVKKAAPKTSTAKTSTAKAAAKKPAAKK